MKQLNDHKRIIIYSSTILVIISIIAATSASFIYAHLIEKTHSWMTHIEIIATTIAAVIGFGILLLYSFLLPSVRKISSLQENAEYEKLRLKSIINHIMESIITTDNKGRIKDINPAALKLFGYTEEEVIGKNIWHLIPQSSEEIPQEINSYLSPGKKEVVGITKSHQEIPLQLAVQQIDLENQSLFVGIMYDISQTKKKESELSYQAHYDALTGLLNRRQFEEQVRSHISSAERYQQKFALLFIDIDHFKEINDTLGHDAGDELLKVISERLKKNIRKSDIAGRLGGDEFVILLNGAHNLEITSVFAEKIIGTIKSPIKIKNTELFITCSIGISFYNLDGIHYESLVKSADLALYAAKEKGRNNFQFCTPEMNAQVLEKNNIKNALRLAIANNELQMVYQPKKSLRHDRIIGFEAFIRWENEKIGSITPINIINYAEEMGLTIELGEWIVKTALHDAKKWNSVSGIKRRLTLNISSKYYLNSQFLTNFVSLLEEANLPPKSLELEITENLIMRDPEYSLKTIYALQNNGIDITIDNFGTGYSSLSYLHQFKVNSIKTDRKFTQTLISNQDTAAFLRGIANLAKSLGLKVQAEGVETKEQYECLFEMGYDEVQGYYIGKPIQLYEVLSIVKDSDKAFQELER